MTRIVYVNGCYLPESEASISIFDRGFLMADAVYEVIPVLNGNPIEAEGHLRRLQHSLDELELTHPLTVPDWGQIFHHLILVNHLMEGLLYLQVTRGSAADRAFSFPDPLHTSPTVVAFTQHKPGLANNPLAETGMKLISLNDLRWSRCDIKTTQLLYPALAKREAQKAGADDAWLIRDGFVTEGSSSNAYIVKDGKLITRHLGNAILAGVTRTSVLRLAAEDGIPIEERSFTLQEVKAADEAFLTSASTFVMPVVEIDGHPIGSGKPGPLTLNLRKRYVTLCHTH
ncbi:MAG: D-amino-acid transaminase [Kiritimatiellia bacterium]